MLTLSILKASLEGTTCVVFSTRILDASIGILLSCSLSLYRCCCILTDSPVAGPSDTIGNHVESYVRFKSLKDSIGVEIFRWDG